MRRYLAALALLLVLGVTREAEAAWSYVGGTVVTSGHVISWTPTATGNLLLIGYVDNFANDTLGVSDDGGNTWTCMTCSLADTVHNRTISNFYAIANGTSALTITMDGSGATYSLTLAEYHSTISPITIDSPNLDDNPNHFADNSGNATPTVGTGSNTSSDNELIVSWIVDLQNLADGTTTFYSANTSTYSYTKRAASSNDGVTASTARPANGWEDVVVTPPNLTTANWTGNTTDAYYMVLMPFQAVAAATTTPKMTLMGIGP